MYKKLKLKFVNAPLRRKIVLMMSVLITIIPTILFSILAYTYFKLGIELLFNEKISRSLDDTVKVAEAYLKEHKDNIQADALSISKSIESNAIIIINDPSEFTLLLDKQAELRKLSEIYVFKPDTGTVIAKNRLLFSLFFEKLPDEAIRNADKGEVVILDSANNEKVRAIVKLGSYFPNTYLLVGKYVDPSILEHLKNTQGSADQFQFLMHEISATQLKLEIVFLVTSVLLCLTAIGLGVRLAHYITKPINRLVEATERVKVGDYSIKLPEKQGKDETAILTRAFNKMIAKISTQREELIKFNNIIDERRRFIEAVLSELSAGVIALDMKSRITLYNNAAANLLNMKSTGKTPKLDVVFPEVLSLVQKTKDASETNVNKNLEIIRKGQKRQFFVRIYAQRNSGNEIESIIVTFDDITELVSAQRTSAWSDVARRIAHEIKNPLTPIHLAAERLHKKYLPQIKTDPENYKKYLDTIIRHVSDIGMMAEEFAKFARIPRPVMKKHDIVSLLKDEIFAQECSYKNIKYTFDTKLKSCIINCDSLQVSQVLINILKNSAESIEAKAEKRAKNFEGKIIVTLKATDQFADISISDNGIGFPGDLLDRIFEPYITTKTKGTGLGLSIVKKMIEDHGGSIKVEPLTTGACVKFTLQLYSEGNNAKN